ncbi:YdcF family protein [Sporolactobacillus sp. Y61]|uniref:YdcF family protein n=1 Tax=Sporolactobacillus sp. Y61 TaxID=3160863 RepID=A0AAU8IIW9_9BACL
MEYVIKFIYGFILPPGLFITLLFVMGIRLFRRRRKLAYLLLGLGLLQYLAFIPLTGILLLHPLENRYAQPAHPDGDVIVMLGGGATLGTPDLNGTGNLGGDAANRLITIVRLYRETGLPVILSGGKVYSDSGTEAEIGRRQLIAMGVPSQKIIPENQSITTRTNAENIKRILRQQAFRHPILVTSAYHMPRAVQNFSKLDVSVQPYPTGYLVSRQLKIYPGQFVPGSGRETFVALKEYVGLLASLL